MITICKTTLSGLAPAQIREQTGGLASCWLRDLAAELAQDPALTVSVITYADGVQELEVLHTGPPPPADGIIDSRRFARPAGPAPAQTLPIAGPPDVQHAAALVRTILLDGPAPEPDGPALQPDGSAP